MGLSIPNYPVIFNLVDELFVIILFVVSLPKINFQREKSIIILLCILFTIGAISGLLQDSSITRIGIGFFVYIKGPLLFISFKSYAFTKNEIQKFTKWLLFVSPIYIIGWLIHLYYKDSFISVFNMNVWTIEYRVGIPVVTGLITIPSIAASFFYFVYVGATYLGSKMNIIAFIISFMMFRVKQIMASFVVLFLRFYKQINIKTVIASCCFIFLLFNVYTVLYPEHYEQYFDNQHSLPVRLQLINVTGKILNDDFPLGEGFGSFCSPYSISSFSDTYKKYELTYTHNLSSDSVEGIYDLYWAMVLGEVGILGAIIFICMLYKIFKPFIVNYFSSKRTPESQYAVCIIAYCILSSVTLGVCHRSPEFLFLFGIPGLVYNIMFQKTEN
jgi:hypothetical protein